MAGLWRGIMLAGLLASAVAAPVHGQSGYWCWPPCYRVVYYPVCPPWGYRPLALPMPPAPLVVPYRVPLAMPEVAPASSTQEPPLHSPLPKGPKISESRSLSTTAPEGEQKIILANLSHCKVGFWNLTGREITLVVNGKSHTLARDRALTLDLQRNFTWQIDKDEPRNEVIAGDQAHKEILLRLPPTPKNNKAL